MLVKKAACKAPTKERKKWRTVKWGNFNSTDTVVDLKPTVEALDTDKYVMEQVLLMSEVYCILNCSLSVQSRYFGISTKKLLLIFRIILKLALKSTQPYF